MLNAFAEIQLQQSLTRLKVGNVSAWRVSNGFAGTRNAEAELDRWKLCRHLFRNFLARSFGYEARNVLPTAIGLMPPSFLASAHKDAPQKQVEYRPEHGPWDTCWQTQWAEPQADDLHLLLIHWSGTFKCWGRRPSGSPADPGKNALMANNMSDSWRAMDESEFGVATENPGPARNGCWSAIPLPCCHQTSYCVVASRETNRALEHHHLQVCWKLWLPGCR